MRFGLIGCGEIGKVRAAALARAPYLSLAAVSDVDGARASAVAARQHAAVEPDWRALVHRRDVEAVIVSTPPSLHAEMTKEALAAGKHVLCEKPLGRDPEECRAMVDAAARAGRLLATGFNYRFYPSIRKAREILEAGLIGELDHIRASTGYSAAEHNHPWLHNAAVMGGGTLRDNGIHLIDTVCYFLGEVAEIRGGVSGSVWGFPGCEDNGFVLLRNTRGNLASVASTWNEWRGYHFRIEICGTRGSIRTSCFPMITDVVWAPERGGRPRRERFLFPWVHLMEKLRSYRWVLLDSFVREFEAFERAVRGENTPLATGRDGLVSIEIAHAASSGGRVRAAAG